MTDLVRYSTIDKGLKREFLLLQGTGCRWKKCTFCDYYLDVSADPYSVNREVLNKVTGKYRILDIINSGSAPEFDEKTLSMIAEIAEKKNIDDLWFEAHWIYRNQLKRFAEQFPCRVHYRLGIESFNPELRLSWNKGIGRDATPELISNYYDGICLLAGIKGQTEKDIMDSIEIAEKYFSYYSVNLFCPNTTSTERDDVLAETFIKKLAPEIAKSPKAEILIENTDLGVG